MEEKDKLINMDFSQVEARVTAHMLDNAINGRFLGIKTAVRTSPTIDLNREKLHPKSGPQEEFMVRGTVTGRLTNYVVQAKMAEDMIEINKRMFRHCLEIDKRIGVDEKGRPLLNPVRVYDDSFIIPPERQAQFLRFIFKHWWYPEKEPFSQNGYGHMWS